MNNYKDNNMIKNIIFLYNLFYLISFILNKKENLIKLSEIKIKLIKLIIK